MNEDDPLPCIAADADTGPVVKALVESIPAGKNVKIYREWMTVPNLAALWGRTLGVKVQLVKIAITDETVPEPGLRRDFLETFAFGREFGRFN